MDFHLRVDDANPAHVRCTLFANGANCGQLTMRPNEYSAFGRALLVGARRLMDPVTNVTVDVVPITPTQDRQLSTLTVIGGVL